MRSTAGGKVVTVRSTCRKVRQSETWVSCTGAYKEVEAGPPVEVEGVLRLTRATSEKQLAEATAANNTRLKKSKNGQAIAVISGVEVSMVELHNVVSRLVKDYNLKSFKEVRSTPPLEHLAPIEALYSVLPYHLEIHIFQYTPFASFTVVLEWCAGYGLE